MATVWNGRHKKTRTYPERRSEPANIVACYQYPHEARETKPGNKARHAKRDGSSRYDRHNRTMIELF
jgi:hypothetical protein